MTRSGSQAVAARNSRRMQCLLISLVVLLLVHPYLGDSDQLSTSLRFFGIVIPGVGALAVSRNRWLTVVAVGLALPTLLAALGAVAGVALVPALAGILCALAFYLFTTVVILIHVVQRHRVDAETIYGSLVVYLMLGLTWTTAYVLIEQVIPGSFASGGQVPDGGLSGTDLLYFSYVTLTTLGYGDITPVSPQARSLAVVEALAGVLYVAVLISKLVGVYRPDDLTGEPS